MCMQYNLPSWEKLDVHGTLQLGTFYEADMSKKYQGLLYVIPGNPGLSGFYEEFSATFKAHFPEWLCVVTDHVGMDVSEVPRRSWIEPMPRKSLDEQVEHHITTIKKVWKTNSGHTEPNVVVAGHSMGCWLAQRVVAEAIQSVPINKVVMFTPTIKNIRESPQGRVVTPIFRLSWLNAAWLLALISYYTPSWLLRLVVRARLSANAGPGSVKAALDLALTPPIVHQFVNMGHEEMETIESDKYEKFWSLVPEKIRVLMLLSANDHWLGQEIEEYLFTEYESASGVQIQVSDKYPHSFCLAHNEEMVEDMSLFIKS